MACCWPLAPARRPDAHLFFSTRFRVPDVEPETRQQQQQQQQQQAGNCWLRTARRGKPFCCSSGKVPVAALFGAAFAFAFVSFLLLVVFRVPAAQGHGRSIHFRRPIDANHLPDCCVPEFIAGFSRAPNGPMRGRIGKKTIKKKKKVKRERERENLDPRVHFRSIRNVCTWMRRPGGRPFLISRLVFSLAAFYYSIFRVRVCVCVSL